MTYHTPVMENEVIEFLLAAQGGHFLDCTLGGGGHTEAILKANQNNLVTAVDRDHRAIKRAELRLKAYNERITLLHGAFSDLPSLVSEFRFDGILADLGISSDQLSEERGFSFQDDTSLDMRMDEEQALTAEAIVNESTPRELLAILRAGGLGREAEAVKRAIINARPVKDTKTLAQVVSNVVVASKGKKKLNPATLTFQAIRMAVNGELEQISFLMEAVPELIKSEGRLVVITFHSLEDKAVMRIMRRWRGENPPAHLPIGMADAAGRPALGSVLTRQELRPGDDEQRQNPRSRSARLRVFAFNKV